VDETQEENAVTVEKWDRLVDSLLLTGLAEAIVADAVRSLIFERADLPLSEILTRCQSIVNLCMRTVRDSVGKSDESAFATQEGHAALDIAHDRTCAHDGPKVTAQIH